MSCITVKTGKVTLDFTKAMALHTSVLLQASRAGLKGFPPSDSATAGLPLYVYPDKPPGD